MTALAVGVFVVGCGATASEMRLRRQLAALRAEQETALEAIRADVRDFEIELHEEE